MEELFMLNDGTPDGGTETPPATPPKAEEPKVPTKNELMREMSKEYGFNLFDVEGIQKFKEYTESQKTEQQKLQERITEYEGKETQWAAKQLEYDSKLKALELGIASDKLEDALKLAGNDPNNLESVLQKYPIFKATDGVKFGVTDPSTFQNPSGKTEAEIYMEQNYKDNPYYKKK